MRMLLALLLSLASAVAAAHASGSSHLRIAADREGSAIAVRWDIAVADLELPLGLDRDGDGRWSAGEIAARAGAIARFAGDRLGIRRGGEQCRLAVGRVELYSRDAEKYARLQFDGNCPASGRIEVTSGLFFGSPGYTALLELVTPAGSTPALLAMDRPYWAEPAVPSLLATLGQFLREGFRHVLIGDDHVAFLLLLLLPAVLRRSAAGWTAATSRREVTIELLKIVTAFTVAHSITLGLAASGTVRVPVQPIELAIAASIVIAGLLNLAPAAARWRLALAFGFGFVHGFGFANALSEIDAAGARLAPLLAGFNIGVELAQLTIVALVLPVLWVLSRGGAYARRWMPALSLATAMTGAVWFVGRL